VRTGQNQNLLGLVLKKQPLGEADLVVSWYTLQLGKVRTIARGALRSQSRLAFGLVPFIETELRVAGKPEKPSFRLIGTRPGRVLLAGFRTEQAVLATWLAELVLKGTADHASNPELYQVLCAGLQVLGQEQFEQSAAHVFQTFFGLGVLSALGWSVPAKSAPKNMPDLERFDLETLQSQIREWGEEDIVAKFFVLARGDSRAEGWAERAAWVGETLEHHLERKIYSSKVLNGIM